MRNSLLIIVAFIGMSLYSCVKDDGNYTYREISELLPGEIKGIGTDKSYKATTLEPLDIEIEIEGLSKADEEKYDFYWTTYLLNTQIRDTICRTKNLHIDRVNLNSGTYFLCFEIKNKMYGTSKHKYSMLYVSSQFTTGWFILRDKDHVTELDLITKEGKRYDELLKMKNGKSLKGEAVKFSYLASMYKHEVTHPDGTKELLKDLKAYFVSTTEDIGVYNAESIVMLKDSKEVFISAPATLNPHGVFIGLSGLYLMNDHKIHTLSFFQGNRGQVGLPPLGDYRLNKDMCLNGNMSSLVFDEVSSSFKGYRFGTSTLSDLSEIPGVYSCNHMNCDLVFMREQEASHFITKTGFALLKDKTSGEFYSVRVSLATTQTGKNPFSDFKAIPEGYNIYEGKHFGVNHVNSVIYFSKGDNKVYSYNVDNQIEKEILILPADEKITFLRHANYMTYPDPPFSNFVVATSKGGMYKIYKFEFEGKTSEIVVPSTVTPFTEGNGTARYVTYIGPNSEGIN